MASSNARKKFLHRKGCQYLEQAAPVVRTPSLNKFKRCGTWGHESGVLTGLDDLWVLFQPKQFCDTQGFLTGMWQMFNYEKSMGCLRVAKRRPKPWQLARTPALREAENFVVSCCNVVPSKKVLHIRASLRQSLIPYRQRSDLTAGLISGGSKPWPVSLSDTPKPGFKDLSFRTSKSPFWLPDHLKTNFIFCPIPSSPWEF